MSHLFHYFKLGNKNIQAHVHVLVYNQYMYYFENHTEREIERKIEGRMKYLPGNLFHHLLALKCH